MVRNEDVKEVTLEVPENHHHIRTTLVLADGTTLVFQEATIANLVRAYITLKTHPTIDRLTLMGQRVVHPKNGYAEWQLLEEIPQESR